jgi:hypothetical protein
MSSDYDVHPRDVDQGVAHRNVNLGWSNDGDLIYYRKHHWWNFWLSLLPDFLLLCTRGYVHVYHEIQSEMSCIFPSHELTFIFSPVPVWSRIPFASVNLLTACTAVKKNCGVILVAYVYVILAFGWSILWSVALAGVYDQVINVGNGQENSINYGYYFLLFLSFFFTHQVIQNCTHVTVSGTVGSWWFSPQDSGCCSGGVMGSVIRTLTTSFGSVCFGSLLVAILQALKAVASAARSEEGGFLICIAEVGISSMLRVGIVMCIKSPNSSPSIESISVFCNV